jgi:serine/threonine-protein kinase
LSQQILGGRYRVEEQLGRGGMAQVFKGTDTVLGRPVAIKVLAPQFAQDEAFVARFRREAQAAARLNHPNLVSVFDTGSDDGTHYIVMEYVEGRTLADFLSAGGRLMPQRAIELATAVAQGLAFAHAQGVVHRDIKPGNIMVTRQGEVKVMDFGIARLTTSAETIEQTAAVLGTAAYLSPEQARGEAVDARSDIYSLGCVLYEMLVGRPPFSGDSAVAVAYKHVQEAPVPPSHLNADVSPQLDAVVMRALSKNRANRYQSADEMRVDMERAARGDAVSAPPILAVSETQVIARREQTQIMPPVPEEEPGMSPWKKWLVGGLVALILLGGLGAGLWLLADSILGGSDKPTPTPTVSPTVVEVPDVVGFTEQAATKALENAGFVVTVKRKTNDTVAAGTVLSQDPPAGDKLKKGGTVTLTVARAPNLVTVPNVVGMSEADAKAAIEAAGLSIGTTTPQASSTVAAGDVISQDPAADTDVDKATPVDLVVSSGAGTVTVPDVVCLPFSAAKNKLENLGFNVVYGGTATPNPLCPQPNKVAEQDPASGTEAEEGSSVTLYTSGPSPTST